MVVGSPRPPAGPSIAYNGRCRCSPRRRCARRPQVQLARLQAGDGASTPSISHEQSSCDACAAAGRAAAAPVAGVLMDGASRSTPDCLAATSRTTRPRCSTCLLANWRTAGRMGCTRTELRAARALEQLQPQRVLQKPTSTVVSGCDMANTRRARSSAPRPMARNIQSWRIRRKPMAFKARRLWRAPLIRNKHPDRFIVFRTLSAHGCAS